VPVAGAVYRVIKACGRKVLAVLKLVRITRSPGKTFPVCSARHRSSIPRALGGAFWPDRPLGYAQGRLIGPSLRLPTVCLPRNTGTHEALFRYARVIKRPGDHSSHDSEVLYETRFINFVPERAHARCGLLPAACHRPGHVSAEFGQFDAVELTATERGRLFIRYGDASCELNGLDAVLAPELDVRHAPG
jgi:hypothetical protein